jgi:hypothetical protein
VMDAEVGCNHLGFRVEGLRGDGRGGGSQSLGV